MMEPLRGRWTDTNGDTWVPEWHLKDAEKAIFELQTALEEANIYLTLIEGRGEGGTADFDIAAEAVRRALGR